MIQIFKQCINFFKNWYQVFLLLLGFGLLYMYGTMQVKSLDSVPFPKNRTMSN